MPDQSSSPPSSAVIAIKSKSHNASRSSSPSPPSGSPPKDAAYLKRREQVRRAQRTHRERKENYIKALEEQVLDLRTKQREIVRENEALTSEVVQLRELVHCDVPVSATGNSNGRILGGESVNAWMVGTGAEGSHGSDVWGGGSDMTAWQISAFSSVGDATSSEAWIWQGGGGIPVTWAGGHVGPSSTASPLSHPSRRPTPSRFRDLDGTDLAVEFVMTLEKPCINRATSTVLDLGERNVDYALQAPSAGAYHTFLEGNILQTKESEVDVNDSLDKLLALSANFKLVGEVTPIQAWQHIASHPQFWLIRTDTMRRLVGQLLWHVKCYGFGAVINISILNQLLRNVLVA